MQSALQSRLPNVKLFHCYGMTETTFTTFCGEMRADKPGSPGTLVRAMECKVGNLVKFVSLFSVSCGSKVDVQYVILLLDEFRMCVPALQNRQLNQIMSHNAFCCGAV